MLPVCSRWIFSFQVYLHGTWTSLCDSNQSFTTAVLMEIFISVTSLRITVFRRHLKLGLWLRNLSSNRNLRWNHRRRFPGGSTNSCRQAETFFSDRVSCWKVNFIESPSECETISLEQLKAACSDGSCVYYSPRPSKKVAFRILIARAPRHSCLLGAVLHRRKILVSRSTPRVRLCIWNRTGFKVHAASFTLNLK